MRCRIPNTLVRVIHVRPSLLAPKALAPPMGLVGILRTVGTWQTLLGSLQDDTAFGILRQVKFFHLPSLSTCMDCHFRGFMMFDVGVFT